MMTRALVLIIAPLACLAMTACHHADPAASMAQAERAYAAEDYVRARTAVLAALDAGDATRAMLVLLVRADLALGDGDGAQSALSRLSDLGATGPDIAEMTAQAALLRGQARQVAAILGDDASAESWRLRAAAALAQNDGAAAAEAFRRGLAAGPDYRFSTDYARYLLDAEDFDGAQAQWAQMHKLGPGRLDTLLVAADIARRRGQFDAARQAYATAARAYPFRSEPLVGLADMADIAGQGDQVAAYAERARALAPNDPHVFSLTVRVAAEKGEWTKVRDMLAPREGTLDVRSFEGLAYGEALLELKHPEQARAIFQKALLLSPQNPYARLMLARSYLGAGDAGEALHMIRPLADSVLAGARELDIAIQAAQAARDPSIDTYLARRASPQIAQIAVLNGQAMGAMNRGQWAAAIDALRAIPGYDGDAEVLRRLAVAALRAGQGDAAIAYADRAMELDPRNPDMLHIAGLTRLRAGRDRDLAQTLLRQACDLDPANTTFRADYAEATGAS